MRNKEVLLRVREQRNILHEISKRKANWIGHILRRNCLLQGVIEGKIKGRIEMTGRRGSRRKKLLDDLKERRGYKKNLESRTQLDEPVECVSGGGLLLLYKILHLLFSPLVRILYALRLESRKKLSTWS